MKTFLLAIALIAILPSIYGQNPVYQQKMAEALVNYSNAKTLADFKNSAAEFERISMVASDQWLPLYYHAQCYILMSFNDPEGDAAQKDEYLDVSRLALDKMIKMEPNETEIFALEALHNTAKLVIDPMNRGQEYGILTQKSIQQSLAIDPQNPRAKQLNLSNKIGTAQFFGQDTSPFCQEASILLTEWDNYSVKSPFHPTWGKDQVESIIANCSAPEESSEQVTANGLTLTVVINKLNNNNGGILLELLDENEQIVKQSLGTIKNTSSTLSIEGLAPGTYAIRFFHDENNNMKMDKNKKGIPTESYGFSNNARGFMGPPKFKKLLFKLDQNQTLTLKAK